MTPLTGIRDKKAALKSDKWGQAHLGKPGASPQRRGTRGCGKPGDQHVWLLGMHVPRRKTGWGAVIGETALTGRNTFGLIIPMILEVMCAKGLTSRFTAANGL